MKYYSLWLPVFKQGDDLGSHLVDGEHPSKAFMALAEQYKSAAEICETVANSIKNIKNVSVDACTHSISISTNSKKIQSLIDLEIISEENFE